MVATLRGSQAIAFDLAVLKTSTVALNKSNGALWHCLWHYGPHAQRKRRKALCAQHVAEP